MVLENLAVRHKSFGDGIIVVHDDKYITVRFNEIDKKFVYPDIFEKFLTLADGTVPSEILSDLDSAKLLKQALIDKKNEENVRAMTRGIVIPGKIGTGNENGEQERDATSRETEEI